LSQVADGEPAVILSAARVLALLFLGDQQGQLFLAVALSDRNPPDDVSGATSVLEEHE
jgi:hypothetical protein